MNQPLHLDERLEEQERARLGHVIARWLKKLIPRLAYRPPGCRLSVETQLRQRSRFSAEAWSGYEPQEEVVAILEIIRRELNLPNHNFIPDDSLVLIMSSGYDIDDVYALTMLEERYAVKYTDQEVERIRNEEWTLGRFVKDVLERPREDRPIQYSRRALWGFFIPLVALVVLCVCAIAMPRQHVDYVYGTVIGLCFLLVLAKGWLLSCQGMREIGRSAGKLKGRGFAIAGQVIPPAAVIVLVLWYRYFA